MTEYQFGDSPQVAVLWNGAILGGIVNAVMTAEDPAFAPYRQWIRNHYVLNGCDGREGVVTFAGGHWYCEAPLVGVFFSPQSSRNPFLQGQEWTAVQAFRGASTYQIDLANQAAMTFLELEVQGAKIQRITTAFWDRDGRLVAPDSWAIVQEHGVELISDEMLGTSDFAWERWRAGYEMSDPQIQLARSLFSRKIDHPPARLFFSESEAEWLRSESKDEQAFDLSCSLFREMDIVVIP